jgi:hypothetical protein
MYGFVDILALAKTRAYTPATVVGEAPTQVPYPAASRDVVLRVPSLLPARPPRLLERVRAALRARHYSGRAKDAYIAWIRRYILFHDKRHPAEMGAAEVTRFLRSNGPAARVARRPAAERER